jgi:hypothetical protein
MPPTRLKLLPIALASSAGSGLAALAAAYKAQSAVLVRHFDEGGALSLDWKKGVQTSDACASTPHCVPVLSALCQSRCVACPGTDSLGEPLKINTWRQFYRACGPPVIARTGALLVSVYIAGGASAFVARCLYPEPPLPRSEAKKKRA